MENRWPYGSPSVQFGFVPSSSPENQTRNRPDEIQNCTYTCTGSTDSVLYTTQKSEEEDYLVSDCESSVSGSAPNVSQPSDNHGLIRLPQGDRVHDLIKRRLLCGLGPLGAKSDVASVSRNAFRGALGLARFQSFNVFAKAVEQKHGGGNEANVRYAWYGAASAEEIREVIEHGFGEPKNNGLYGYGVYLSPDASPMDAVMNAAADSDGLRHLLLCRVILGKSEIVHPGSDQSCPSSPDFDSGVNSLQSPKKYIVWSTHMNTRILPEFVVSFRAPVNLHSFVRVPEPLRKPSSPWMAFPALISALSKFLSASSMRLVMKHYKDHKEKKLSRYDMIQQLRLIAGDRLLVHVIKASRGKMARPAQDSQRPVAEMGTRSGMENKYGSPDFMCCGGI